MLKFLIFFICLQQIIVQSTANGRVKYFDSHPLKANWYTAMRICRSIGLDLVSVDTEIKQLDIEHLLSRREIPHKHEMWTSGTDFGMNDVYYWMSTGNVLVYTNWMPNEPSRRYGHTEENCISLRKDHHELKWNDAPCNNELEFICESIRQF